MTRLLRSLAILAVTAAAGSALTAQIPAATAYVGLLYSLGTNTQTRLVCFDGGGTVTTLASFPGRDPRGVEEIPGQNALAIWSRDGVTRYDRTTGAATHTTLSPSGTLGWGYVDEDGGLVWYDQSSVYKSDDLRGQNRRVVASVSSSASNGTWNGSTGGFATLLRQGFSNDIAFYDRAGALTHRSFASISPSDLSWNPWRGGMLLSEISSGTQRDLTHVSGQGTKTPVAHGNGPLFGSMYEAAVVHQPVEHYLCAKSLSNPDYLFTVQPDGTARTLAPYRQRMLDVVADVLALGDRSLWGAGAWTVGQPGAMTVDFGPSEAGRRYQVALSFAHRPGLSFGAKGTAHVAADDLFRLSLQGVPGLFEHLGGTLDAQGRPPVAPGVRIPAIAGLSGLRVFASCVTYDAGGVRRVSNAWGITIR